MKKTFKQTFGRLPVLALGGAVVIALTAAAVGTSKEQPSSTHRDAVALAVDEHPLARDGRMDTSFAPVVKKVVPSVVKVFTTTKARQASLRDLPQMQDPSFRQFFGDQLDRSGRPGQLDIPAQQGAGSGVIVTKDGYILTNNHVVEHTDQLKVALNDGREFTAKVIGADPKSDIAVIKIDAKDLPFLTMADSDQSEVGDRVLAIGNPFGVGQTVTSGIISAKGRATMGLDYEDFIQTDAAINPGNSGGALVDVEGRLIGINTAILSHSGGSQGVGFAIPANLTREVMTSLIKYGKVTRGYLGVMIQDVTPALASEFKLKDGQGALVGDVLPKGPADVAGLKDGDVIVDFNGKPVTDSRHLKLEVASLKPGETVPVKLLRDGHSKTLDVTLKELPGTEQLTPTASGATEDGEALKGVAVGELDAQTRQHFDVPQNIAGAVVTEVAPGSAAAEAGLKPGDVITEINHRPVRNAEDAVKLTERVPNKTTLLHIWSGRGSRYVAVDESKAS